MFDRFFSALYSSVEQNKRGVLFILILFLIAGLAGLYFLEFESNIELMLPRHEVIRKNIDFLRGSNISGKVIVSLGIESPDAGKDELIAAVDRQAAALDPALFPKVTTGVSEAEMASELGALLQALPMVATEEDLARIDSLIEREEVSRKLRENYRQLLKPGGIFMHSMVRSDPLNLKAVVLEKLQSMTGSVGYDLEMEDGHFMSRDGRHAMLIADTTVPVTDTVGARRMLDYLEKTLAGLPEHISADVICGHTHTVSNEDVMRRDIRLTLVVASAGFIALFVGVIGDLSAVLIFLIPLFSVLLSVNISSLILGRLSYSVIGIGAVVAGISVDYGIHVYIAARSGRDPGGAVRHVAKPVTIGALTTLGIFLAFFFSRIEGYHQMALFSILSVVIALFCSIAFLPHYLRTGGGRDKVLRGKPVDFLEGFGFSNNITVVIWAVSTLLLLYSALGVEFRSSLSEVDGTSREVLEAEERFGDVWGKKKLAILVAQADTYDSALELNEQIYRDSAPAIGAENFSSLAELWMSGKTRRENMARWKSFWLDGREQKLRRLLGEEGVKYGFTDDAFEPFFENLHAAPNPSSEFPLSLGERFLQKNGSGYQVLSFFPDEREFVDSVSRVAGRYPGTYLVSGNVMSGLVAEVVSADMRTMTWAAAGFVMLLTLLFLRKPRDAAAALVPVLTSVVWLLGLLPLLGLSLNVANLVANIVVMGLCVDYGIFMAYRSRSGTRTGTVTAVTLSAVSTLVGAGVLLFAKHPALFSIGVTLVTGVSAGYLSSVFVVPRLCGHLQGDGQEGGAP